MELTSAKRVYSGRSSINDTKTSIVKSLFNSEFHQAQEVDFSKLPSLFPGLLPTDSFLKTLMITTIFMCFFFFPFFFCFFGIFNRFNSVLINNEYIIIRKSMFIIFLPNCKMNTQNSFLIQMDISHTKKLLNSIY